MSGCTTAPPDCIAPPRCLMPAPHGTLGVRSRGMVRARARRGSMCLARHLSTRIPSWSILHHLFASCLFASCLFASCLFASCQSFPVVSVLHLHCTTSLLHLHCSSSLLQSVAALLQLVYLAPPRFLVPSRPLVVSCSLALLLSCSLAVVVCCCGGIMVCHTDRFIKCLVCV